MIDERENICYTMKRLEKKEKYLMKKTVLRKYADLIVRKGINVQKGQEVIVYAGLDQPEFIQMVVVACYKAKAK